jgi:UDP:flavonoid glycosyltransferase YjiC (YdhE family)
MRVLVASTSGAGHRLPPAAFADALEAAGHEVRRLVSDPPRDPRWERFGAMSREEQTVFVEREWFGRICAAHLRPRVEAACEEARPDLIIREPCEYASAIVAVERGIPFVTVAITNAEGEWGATAKAGRVLPGAVVEALRERPFLSRFPASLDPSPYPRTHRYAERVPPGSTRELVYATFGTVAPCLGAGPYRALLDAVDGLDVDVLLTTGDDLDLAPVPDNVRVERWVPQAEALARAKLVVCHGGSGTVLGALAAGIPLVILPLFADQATNAERLVRAGAARAVTPGQLREAILDPPPPPLEIARELRAAPPLLTALEQSLEGLGLRIRRTGHEHA